METSVQTRNEIKQELDKLVSQIRMAKGLLCDETPNDLLREYYAKQGHTELKTFSQWHDAGYRIKAGAKSLKLWSSPKTGTHTDKDSETGQKLVVEYEYYSYIVLFSQLQVEKDDAPKKSKKYFHRKHYSKPETKQQELPF